MQTHEALEIPVATFMPLERGSNKRLKLTTYESIDQESLYMSLTGAQILFELRKSKSSSPLFTKKNITAGGADNQILIETSSTFTLFFEPGDTDKLQEFTYWGWFKITTATNEIQIIWVRIPFI